MSKDQRSIEREEKRVRRAILQIAGCADCGRGLAKTHRVDRYGEKCQRCYRAFVAGDVAMASR